MSTEFTKQDKKDLKKLIRQTKLQSELLEWVASVHFGTRAKKIRYLVFNPIKSVRLARVFKKAFPA